MKIDSSTMHFSASHTASIRAEVRATVRAWVGSQPPQSDGNGNASSASSVVALSAAARDAAMRVAAESAAPPPPNTKAGGKGDNDPLLNLIRLVVEALTGISIGTVSTEDIKATVDQLPPEVPLPQGGQETEARPAPVAPAGYGIEYDEHTRTEEKEQASFDAEGVIRTSDGKEIKFNLTLSMSRTHIEESGVSLRAGDAVKKDPLVLNFGGAAAQLHGGRFKFDLDGDGVKEDMPTLGGGSGYLALDLNGNGTVDSGKELFGPATGNGFAELAQYDSDGNGWIDENDPVFQQLGIWTPGSDLKSLKERNVGALFTGNIATPFELKDADQASLGAVRSSGVYLTEDGKAGSMQQIDLMI